MPQPSQLPVLPNTLHCVLTACMAVVHEVHSKWFSKHDTKSPAAQSSEDSTVIPTEHDAAASGKSRKRKAAEALLNRIHLAADSGAHKKQHQKASVVSYCCCVVPWVVSIKFWPLSASQQCLFLQNCVSVPACQSGNSQDAWLQMPCVVPTLDWDRLIQQVQT